MKLLYRTRQLFQLLCILSVFLIIGSLGAWETGGISFFELTLQLLFFGGCALFCAKKGGRPRPAAIRNLHGASRAGRVVTHPATHTAGRRRVRVA